MQRVSRPTFRVVRFATEAAVSSSPRDGAWTGQVDELAISHSAGPGVAPWFSWLRWVRLRS